MKNWKQSALIGMVAIIAFGFACITCDDSNDKNPPDLKADYFGTWKDDDENQRTLTISANNIKMDRPSTDFQWTTGPCTWIEITNDDPNSSEIYSKGYNVIGTLIYHSRDDGVNGLIGSEIDTIFFMSSDKKSLLWRASTDIYLKK